ncbi:MAG: hypothetical protein IJS94_08670, partial [Clostridia bacterium]|nr:hypothetical protein [Clostridia bacterium]
MITNMQNLCSGVSIVLPTSSCLSGATVCSGGYAAVDGHSPYIFLFDKSGCFTAAVPARRPYGSISTNDTECFVCCGCGCDKNVYYLNDRFEETGVMTPDRSSGNPVSASFYTGEPFENCVAVTFDRSVDLFRRSGEYIAPLKRENTKIRYLCYQDFPGGDCTACVKGGVPIVVLNGGDAEGCSTVAGTGCEMPRAIILKPCGDIDCVIGYRYLYN